MIKNTSKENLDKVFKELKNYEINEVKKNEYRKGKYKERKCYRKE